MRDGLATIHVLNEMKELNIPPDQRRYAMAMFACLTSRQCSLAEAIIQQYLQDKQPHDDPPDVILCTLWLRALLQQNKWKEGLELLNKMKEVKVKMKVNQKSLSH